MQGQFRPDQSLHNRNNTYAAYNNGNNGNNGQPVLTQHQFSPVPPVYSGEASPLPQNLSGTTNTPAPYTQRSSPQPVSKTNKNRIVVGSVVLAFVVIAGIAAGILHFLSKSSTDVTLYQTGTQNVTQYVGGGGIVFPRQQVVISYPIEEQAINVLVKPGDTVTANQPLIQLDPNRINIQINQASDDLAAAQAYLNSVSASGTSVAIAQAQQQYDIAKSKYNALVSQYSSLTVHNGNLVATMAGVVTEVDVNPGEIFTANEPLLTIMDESAVIVHVKIPLSNLSQVQVGQNAQITPSALPNVSLKGQVSSIIPQADPQTDTFEVWVTVSDPGKNLLPGMSAFVQIQNAGTAMVVPRLAVLNPDRDSAVFVYQQGHVFLRQVSVTGRGVGVLYIGKGLSSHDEVVLVGLYELHDGQQVRVVHVEQAEK